jgi:hypothetical protein
MATILCMVLSKTVDTYVRVCARDRGEHNIAAATGHASDRQIVTRIVAC